MTRVVKVTKPEVVGVDAPSEDLIDESLPFRAEPRTNEELEDFEQGLEAGMAGKRNDATKSEAWQRGWADAQE
jgi:hypothetical protein